MKIDFSNFNNPYELAKQLLFDCAMELIYHTDGATDEQVGLKILDIINGLDYLEEKNGKRN